MQNGDGNDNGVPLPIRNGEGAPILGPRNPALERQNPDEVAPPGTDHGTIPNLKFSFAAAHNRLLSGGWAREVTVRELPVATQLAGVNMRLKPGGIRELHWHKEAEWAYMLAGSARITAIDPEGRDFIDDVGEGDLWNFPAGIPHSIQGLEQGCEFLLVFDSGNFSENETFLITDWFAHTPRDVLAKNFGVPESAFDDIPLDVDHERYLFSGQVPGPIASDAVQSPAGPVPQQYSYRLQAQDPIPAAGGQVRIVDSSDFPVATTIAAALVEVEPGAMRELHWHPNTDEWQYYIAGRGRMTVFASGGKARTFDYQAGDVGYVPFAMGHHIENTGDEPLRFLEMFRSDHFADLSLNQWMALTPPELVRAHLNLDDQTVAALSKEKPIIVQPEHAHRERVQRERVPLDALPDWPAGTIAVLATVEQTPHAIPVSAALRAGDHSILFALVRSRGSLERLRTHEQVALTVLTAGDIAFTARGRARIIQEPMVNAPEHAAVALDVEHIDDHRQSAFLVESGVDRRWTNRDKQRSFGEVVGALRQLVVNPV
jgi:oxalate decarboxylase